MSLSRRLPNAARVVAMERSRNCYFFVREENPGQRSRRKSLDLQERTKAQPVFHRRIFLAQLHYSLSALLMTSTSAMPTKTHRVNKFARWKPRFTYGLSNASNNTLANPEIFIIADLVQ
jgi:hypothetical protein